MNKKVAGAAGQMAQSSTSTGFPSAGFGQKPLMGQPTQPAFGAAPAMGAQPTFGAQPGAFGSAPKPAGLFGAPAAPAAQPAGFGFGAQPPKPAFGFGAAAAPAPTPAFGAGGSLFGQAPAATPAFGAPPAQPSAFGAPAPAFGQTAPAPSAAFGQPPAPQPFGAAAGATSAFGAAKPAFGFGQSAAPTLGAAPAATPAPSGGLFGQTAAAPAAPTFGGFGQPAAGSSLFGKPPAPAAPLFGAPPTNNMFSAPKPAGLFGAAPAAVPSTFGGGSLFGSAAQPQQPTQSLFGATSQQPTQSLSATLDVNPYGYNPLLQKSTPASTTAAPALLGTTGSEKKKTMVPNFKVTPRSSSKIKPRGVGPVLSGPQFHEQTPSRLTLTPGSARQKSLHMLDGSPKDAVSLGLDARFTPRRNVKRLTISDVPESPRTTEQEKRNVSFDPVLEDQAQKNMPRFENELLLSTPKQKQASPLVQKTVSSSPRMRQASPQKEDGEYIMDPPLSTLLMMSDKELSQVENFSLHVEGIGSLKFLEPVDLLHASPTGTRAGIQQIPGRVAILEPKLCTVYPDESAKPPVGFGLNVPAEIQLHGCWPLEKATRVAITDQKDPRHDRHMEKLSKMPDTEFLGFHNPTGTWKFRVDHFSRYGLLDDDDDEATDAAEAVVPQTDESIQKDDTWDESVMQDSFLHIKARRPLAPPDSSDESEQTSVEGEDDEYSTIDEGDAVSIEDASYTEDYELSQQTGEESGAPASFQEQTQAAKPTIERLQLAQKVQSVKSFLFHSPKVQKPPSPEPITTFSIPKRPTPAADSHKIEQRASFSPTRQENVPLAGPSPQKYLKSQQSARAVLGKAVKLESSIIYGKEKYREDMGLFMGRSCRVGWGPGDKFIVAGRAAHSSNIATVGIRTMMPLGADCDKKEQKSVHKSFFHSVLHHTNVTVTNCINAATMDEDEYEKVSDMSCSKSGVPFATLIPTLVPKSQLELDTNFSHFDTSALGAADATVIKLASALWDPTLIELYVSVIPRTEKQIEAKTKAIRNQNVSQWLSQTIKEEVEQDANSNSGAGKVFCLLTGRTIARAVEEALLARNYRLATCLSQIAGAGAQVGLEDKNGNMHSSSTTPGRGATDLDFLSDIDAQVKLWKPTEKDLIEKDILAIWKLLSGNIEHWDSSVFRPNFSWQRAWGLFLWYFQGSSDIKTSVEMFEDCVKQVDGFYPPVAYPAALKTDLQFSLFKLATDSSLSLEECLDPRSHQTSMLDSRLVWLIGTMLSSVKSIRKYKDTILEKVTRTDTTGVSVESLASPRSVTYDLVVCDVMVQLEYLGLWEWAIFMATFLSSPFKREQSIKKILSLYYPVDDASGSWKSLASRDEGEPKHASFFIFLTIKCRVPEIWIHEARSIRAKYHRNIPQQVVSLIDADHFDSAHRLAISQLVPDAIISGNFELVKQVLEKIPTLVPNFERMGGLVLRYIKHLESEPQEFPEFLDSLDKEWIKNVTPDLGDHAQVAKMIKISVRIMATRVMGTKIVIYLFNIG